MVKPNDAREPTLLPELLSLSLQLHLKHKLKCNIDYD
jgi:hypothetical protein